MTPAEWDATSWVAFTVYREFFDRIVEGSKETEYRSNRKPWSSYLASQPRAAVFLCGRRIHRRRVTLVETINGGETIAFRLGEAL